MADTESKIHAASSRNQELLKILSETDYAPPALEQQQKYIADINHELQQLSSRISTLETKRVKEHKEHEKYRDSVMKRFAYRVGRKTEKFEARAEKEEREYFDALHEEHQAKEHQKYLQQNLSEANTQKSQLEQTTQRHRQAQTDLDALYDSIFEGPTPGFEEEDAKEQAAEQALSSYHNLRMQLEGEQQALHLLDQARQKMALGMRSMDDARSASQMDMFGGGMMMDMMERNALSRAENQASEAQMLIMQASRMSGHVNAIPKVNVASGGMLGDVLFDNPFSDYKMHQRIKQSQEEMGRAAQAAHVEWDRGRRRVEDMSGRLKGEERRLEEARLALQGARSSAFEKVAGTGGGAGGSWNKEYEQHQATQSQYGQGGQ